MTWLAIGEVIAAAPEAKPSQRSKLAAPVTIPKVLLSKQGEALCRVRVGDKMPAIALPQIGGSETKLDAFYGKKATVVVFWKSNRFMAQQELRDLGPEVIDRFGKEGVSVVGIAVKESEASAESVLKKAGAKFAILIDANGDAFAKVGSEKLPRTYLLDPQGKILWFDIEYSLATRRELKQALHVVTAGPAAPARK
ncbi:MAG TPA: TlpA disulfide reductase family protein [Lacipirellulaceae bacterium]|nr:TlpA disulfide reductase family protein [Lacipirellulaceae bacterium]